MLHEYPSLNREQILYDLPSMEGWALLAWAHENDPWGSLERISDGYIAQERDRIR